MHCRAARCSTVPEPDVEPGNRQACNFATPAAPAQASRAALQKSGQFKKISTEVQPAAPFYVAEDYHQDYARKNPVRYNYYRLSCGRDAQLKRVWKMPGN